MRGSLQIDATSHLGDELKVLSLLPQRQDGNISWPMPHIDESTFTLLSILQFKPPVDDYLKGQAIWAVLNECAKEENFTREFFIRRLRAFIATRTATTPKSFLVVTQINCRHHVFDLPLRLPSINGHVDLVASLSARDWGPIRKLPEYDRQRFGLHEEFIYMTTLITAPDERSALDAGYRNIKYTLGILNMVFRGFGITLRIGMSSAPIGRYLTASPTFTINRRQKSIGGFLIEDHFPLTHKSNFTVSFAVRNIDLLRQSGTYRSDIKKTDFSDRVIQAIIMLQEGLEMPQIDIALLKFWTGIEVLCAKREREPTEDIIERASSVLSPNPESAKIRLNFIQRYRNSIVHRGEAGDHAALCAQWGSLYLFALIRFFLFNRHRFRTHSQILEYLSTPSDPIKLEHMMALYRKRLKLARTRNLPAAP